MDNYPEHLAPAFNEGGGVETPFEEWWANVKEAFPTVPENVARHWLHEHWGHSPYRWLRSADYKFALVKWPAADLWSVRSCWCNFDAENQGCVAHGEHLITGGPSKRRYPTAQYMVEAQDFPSPIIVLDNLDGNLQAGVGGVPEDETLPAAYLLIEGHRRFNMALYLQRSGKFVEEVDLWLMERTKY